MTANKSILSVNNMIHVNQGEQNSFDFYISKLKASDIIEYSNIIRLSENMEEGIQRFLDMSRVKSIAQYCKRDDAIFPTPIILALNSDFITNFEENEDSVNLEFKINVHNDQLNDFGKPFSIIDGQHRIQGIKRFREMTKEMKDFELPVIIYLNANQNVAANIFVTINSNQRTVDSSLIYQLFGIMYEDKKIYTVQSFANEVTQILNLSIHSPFKDSIRMLGKKMNDVEFISQGTIAKKITDRITTPANIELDNYNIEKGEPLQKLKGNVRIFRDYLINYQPEVVAKIMINFFSAFSKVFKDIWVDKGYITKKAVGFSALMRFLDFIYKNNTDLSTNNLEKIFMIMHSTRREEVNKLFNVNTSSESVANNISEELIRIYLETNN